LHYRAGFDCEPFAFGADESRAKLASASPDISQVPDLRDQAVDDRRHALNVI
jgi:hypothetical protein